MQPYRDLIEQRIDAWRGALPKSGLYEPMSYLMRLPAKRVRPIATLMACELFGGRAEDAMDEALGIELFHNFSLMHDDIMDASPLRRGDPTVHMKWDVNTAILSGDAMLVMAYQLMARDPRVLSLFSKCALEVCEGQQLDMEFEQREAVGDREYRKMIRAKTAVLLACALQVGAIKGGAKEEDITRIGRFGEQLGLAFQLRDDHLDAFGDPGVTGKQRGGDLRAGKKTAILIRGCELEQAQGGRTLFGELQKPVNERDALRMISTLQDMGVMVWAEGDIERQEAEAMKALEAINVAFERKAALRGLAQRLMGRTA